MVYCVNDVAVMKAWSLDQMVEGSDLINFYADQKSELTEHLDVVLDDPGPMA